MIIFAMLVLELCILHDIIGKMKGEIIMDKYYEIKVIIREPHPSTWRRLRITSNITLMTLLQ